MQQVDNDEIGVDANIHGMSGISGEQDHISS